MLLNWNLHYDTFSKKLKKLQKLKKTLSLFRSINSDLNLLAADLAWTDTRLLTVFIYPGYTFSCWFWMLPKHTLREVLGKVWNVHKWMWMKVYFWVVKPTRSLEFWVKDCGCKTFPRRLQIAGDNKYLLNNYTLIHTYDHKLFACWAYKNVEFICPVHHGPQTAVRIILPDFYSFCLVLFSLLSCYEGHKLYILGLLVYLLTAAPFSFPFFCSLRTRQLTMHKVNELALNEIFRAFAVSPGVTPILTVYWAYFLVLNV